MNYMYLFFNNILETEENFKIPFSNRGFNYGDGLFETMIFKNNSILYLQDHYERLTGGMKALSIEIPEFIHPDILLKSIQNLVNKNNINDIARIKILAHRKSGGLYTPASGEADVLITAGILQPNIEIKARAFFFEAIKLHPSAISGYKTCNALPYVLASIARKKMNADEMILTDAGDHIAECTNSNIFWIKDDTFYSPSLDTGCIDGVKRKQIIKFLKESRINYKEGKFSRKDLLKSELVFTCNVTGTSVIKEIENHLFATTHPLYEELKNNFK
jgi:4-amino-4-deoxychorismate lyase